MEMQEMVASLVAAGHHEEHRLLNEKLAALAAGQGGGLFIKSEADFGQNILMRSLIQRQQFPCYLGKCQPDRLSGAYDIFRQCFADFFVDWQEQSNVEFSQALTTMDQKKYKGRVGRISRKISRKQTDPVERPWYPHLIATEFTAYLLGLPLPFVVFLEDLHWADISSLKLLQFLVPALRRHPILILLSASPEVLDTPELPVHLRGANVPVIEQIKAMQLAKRSRIAGQDQKHLLQELQEIMPSKEFLPVSDELLLKILKKLLSANLSRHFQRSLIALSQGNTFFLGQIMLFLSEHLLELHGKRWQLKYSEDQISLPRYIEDILQTNIEKFSDKIFSGLEYAAVAGSHLPIDLWCQVGDIPESEWDGILTKIQQRGVLQKYGPDQIVFSSEKQRQTILNTLIGAEKKIIFSKWAKCLEDSGAPADCCWYYSRHSNNPQNALAQMVQAGRDAENMQCYTEAYEFYRQATDEYPECQDVFLQTAEEIVAMVKKPPVESAEPASKKSLQYYKKIVKDVSQAVIEQIKEPAREDKKLIIDKFLQMVALYRVAALVEPTPLFSEDLRWLVEKVMFWHPPQYFFPEIAPLVVFLLKVACWAPKAYPQDDVEFLFHLLTEKLLPSKDYWHQIVFYQGWSAAGIRDNIPKELQKLYEKNGDNCAKQPLAAAENYLTAAFYADQAEEYFHGARLLHKNVQLCQEHLADRDLAYFQIESLYQLGLIYEKWANQQQEEDEILKHAIQATSAYRDAVDRLWQIKDASRFAITMMKRCLAVCERHFLENSIVLELAKTATVKWELRSEDEYKEKILLVADEQDRGAMDILEECSLQEGLYPELLISPDSEELAEARTRYRYCIILANRYSKSLQPKLQEWRISSISCDKRSMATGQEWIIDESDERVTFILLAELPAELYRLVLQFVGENVIRSYV